MSLSDKFKKRRGSTLILLLSIVSVLSILGITIMTITISEYKMKKLDSKAKLNFYMSEAGLDEAYGIIGEVVEEAVNYGKEKVNNYMNSLDLEAEMEKEDSPYILEDGSINHELIKQEQRLVFENGYKKYITEPVGGKSRVIDRIERASYNINHNGIRPVVDVEQNIINFEDDSLITLNVKSTFNNDNIKKVLSVQYDINLAKYNKDYSIPTEISKVFYNTGWSKAITIGGDFVFKKQGDINGGENIVNGDIYVNGSSSNAGGIVVLADDSDINFYGKLITKKDTLINSSDTKFNINGNLYTRNLKISKNTNNVDVNIEKLVDLKGSVYAMDDLEINGSKANVKISGGYYGLADNTESSMHDKSSCININSSDLGKEDGTSLEIDGETYILGTAFIDVGPGYETGESIAVRGNYKAYTYPLNNLGDREGKQSLNKENVYFDRENYIIPLVTKFKNGKDLVLFDKDDYLKFYHQEYQDSSKLNLGEGIKLNDSSKAYHMGAIVHNGTSLIGSNLSKQSGDIWSYINDLKEIYHLYVDKMGDKETSKEQMTIKDYVDFDSMNQEYLNIKDGISSEIVLLENTNDDYVLIGKNGNLVGVPDGAKHVKLDDNKKVKGIIITNGNLYITGEVDFRGTIICNKNLYMMGNSKKKITYDESYITNVISKKSKIFDGLFNNNSKDNYITYKEYHSSTEGSFTQNKLISFKNWKIDY